LLQVFVTQSLVNTLCEVHNFSTIEDRKYNKFWILDLGFGIWDLGFGIWDLGFGIWDLGFGGIASLCQLNEAPRRKRTGYSKNHNKIDRIP